MRWINPSDAQALAFSTPDSRPIVFRLPGHLTQDRVHLLARTAFGYRAGVSRDNGSWVVTRQVYLDDARARVSKHVRRLEQQKRRQLASKLPLRGGL